MTKDDFAAYINESFHPVEITEENEIFGEHYKYEIPLFCAEHNFICLYQPSILIYLVFKKSSFHENGWHIL